MRAMLTIGLYWEAFNSAEVGSTIRVIVITNTSHLRRVCYVPGSMPGAEPVTDTSPQLLLRADKTRAGKSTVPPIQKRHSPSI